MKIAFAILFTIVIYTNPLFAQLDSIYDQSAYRTFIVHFPTGYSTNNQYPIVLNLHGLLSSATQQQSITQFDNIADSKGFIVVYPNATSTLNSWGTTGNSDVDFLSNLVDTIRSNYSANNCLFVTGFSKGGFMTYKFANSTPHVVNAIAIGSGNMSNSIKNQSATAPQIPIMHFHGTEDSTVPYNGTPPFISPVDSTILWWIQHNNCNPSPSFTALPNSNLTDSSTVEKYYYSGGTNGSEVTFYKILNGGHTWSGSNSPSPLGFTNQDINQSTIIGDFFDSFCTVTTGLSGGKNNNSFKIFPNPFIDQLTISNLKDEKITFVLYDNLSHQIIKERLTSSTTLITDRLPSGIYFYEIWNSKKQIASGKVIKN
jgi:polyhydroxybutyrate depolymerase